METQASASSSREARYYERVEKAAVTPLWRIPGTTDAEPKAEEVPHVWRWRELYPLLLEAGEVMNFGPDAERRALNAHNPTRRFGTTHSLVAGYQLVLPGETAPAHRHTAGAIRLMLAGRGHTIVEGEPVLMEPGDLVLTPADTWHDHRHEGEEPMVWLDGLDVPFVKGMRAAFFEDYENQELQPITRAEDDSTRRYGTGLVPAGEQAATLHSPLTNYKWANAHRALHALRESVGDSSHAVRLEYVNPLTGGHVLPTIACYLELLAPGGATAPIRHTSSTVFCALRGSGHSFIAGERYDWEQNDFFAVPSWMTYEHVAGEEEVVLFSMSDRPMLEPFGLYREQRP